MTHPTPTQRHEHSSPHSHAARHAKPSRRLSVLAWPAWRRVATVLPLVLALWLAVAWANMGVNPW